RQELPLLGRIELPELRQGARSRISPVAASTRPRGTSRPMPCPCLGSTTRWVGGVHLTGGGQVMDCSQGRPSGGLSRPVTSANAVRLAKLVRLNGDPRDG